VCENIGRTHKKGEFQWENAGFQRSRVPVCRGSVAILGLSFETMHSPVLKAETVHWDFGGNVGKTIS